MSDYRKLLVHVSDSQRSAAVLSVAAQRARSDKAREPVAEASRLGAMSIAFESPGGAPVLMSH